MKKLALAIASLALVATPVFACPSMDGASAPKTAEKAKDAPKTDAKDTAKTAKPAEKPVAKPADKVSQK